MFDNEAAATALLDIAGERAQVGQKFAARGLGNPANGIPFGLTPERSADVPMARMATVLKPCWASIIGTLTLEVMTSPDAAELRRALLSLGAAIVGWIEAIDSGEKP